ncbi:MAG: hypothetical protein J0I77_21290 [Rudaea sp.]|uniref:glycosyl hydrolase n=1 Tax=unclassified Rudaea TaxID=2627037 RepID=UPI0010F7F1A6|nr:MULTISPECIES: glycosyl hydrolase [unclassified Rudaea]MBN8888262.1 hypothetical protein [Rudaea sp.]MBR0344194.1 hypothetical protein [Rudaea sp.]
MFSSFASRCRGFAVRGNVLAGALMALSTLCAVAPAHATLAQSQVFPGWTPVAGGADITLTADTTTKHGGNQSLKFVNNTNGTFSGANGGFGQVINVQPSTLYHLSAWVSGSNVAYGVTDCFGIDQNFATLQCLPAGTYGWQQMTWNFTTGAADTLMSVALYSVNTGTVWIDDMAVVQDGATTNLLTNPGFENSADSITVLPSGDGVTFVNAFPTGGYWEPVTSTAPSINWSAADINGMPVGSGSVSMAWGPTYFVLPSVGPGWYSLHMTGSTSGSGDAPFTVIANTTVTKPNAFGTNIHPPIVSAPTSMAEVKAIGTAGLSNVRMDLRWELIEKSAGVYTWDANEDNVVNFLVGGGVKPLMTLGYQNPLYDGGHVPSTPQGIAAYAAFAAAAAQHFGTRVDYDVFNEFNVAATNNSACGTTADCYYALIGPAANAIHNAAAGARVVGPTTGGLTTDWLGSNPTSYNWFKRFLDIGGLAYMDVIAIHNYTPLSVSPQGALLPAAPPEGNNDAVINAVRSLLADYSGGTSKPLWLTETGWPTYLGVVTELQQAQYVVRDAALALRAGISEYMYYDFMDDYSLAPGDTNPADGVGRFGLLHNTGDASGALAPKPGYTAYAVLAHYLAGYNYASSDNWGNGIYSLVFASGSTNRRVAWAPAGNTTLAVQSSAAVTVTNWDGRGSTLSPVNGTVTFSVGPDPVYVDGTAISGGGIAATPAFSAAPPATVHQNQTVPLAVSVNGAATGAPTGSVTFRTAYGSTIVTATAGNTVNGTLTLNAFPQTGVVTVPIEVVQGSTVVGRLVVTMNVTP